MGTLDYTEDDYRKDFPNLDFINRKHILAALENDLETRDVDLFSEAEEARFKIPDYQRHYSWEEDDHQRLWYKLLQITQLKAGPGPRPPENFFGTIYVGGLDDRERYEVIDGQQRLTTIAILLECIRREFSNLTPNLSGDIAELASHIQKAWIEGILVRQQGVQTVPFLQVSSHDIGFFGVLFEQDPADQLERIHNLTGFDGRKKYASTLGEVIDELSIPDETVKAADIDDDALDNSYVYFAESHQLLADAFEYYTDELDEFLANEDRFPTDEHAAHALINLSLFILRSFRISEILFNGDNRELRVNVFQELNDAGKPLTTKDKIKARIVSLFQQSDAYTVEDELETWGETVQRFADKSARVEEFLVTYVQATRNPDGAKHARENLLDLFRLTDVGGHEFEPQLTNPSDGHNFLKELNRYSQRYTEIKDLSLEGGTHPLDDGVRRQSEEILRRLTNLNTTQWIPFVLYLYDDVSSTAGKGEFFHEVLMTVESLIFRVSLSEVRTTVIEDTFMESASDFRDAKVIEQVDDPYNARAISELVLRNVEENRQLTGETFADTIIRSRDWGNKRAKQLLMKLVDERFEEDEGMTRRDISDDVSIDIEHTFPFGFVRDGNAANPYAWLQDFFPTEGETLTDDSTLFEQIDLLETHNAAEIDEDHEMYDRIQRIRDHIESDFVRDLGNMMILEGGVNRSVKNQRFALKLRAYNKHHPEDIKNPVNEYFSTANADIPESDIDSLTDLDVISGYDDTDPSLGAVENTYNGWWNIDRMVDRKIDIIQIILESLTFKTTNQSRATEFDELLEDPADLKDRIREDLRKRANQAL